MCTIRNYLGVSGLDVVCLNGSDLIRITPSRAAGGRVREATGNPSCILDADVSHF
jgi:hypothetical protein